MHLCKPLPLETNWTRVLLVQLAFQTGITLSESSTEDQNIVAERNESLPLLVGQMDTGLLEVPQEDSGDRECLWGE